MAVSTIAKRAIPRQGYFSVAPGNTVTISGVDVSEPRLLVCGHGVATDVCGVYCVHSSGIFPIVAGSNLAVSLSGTTLTITNNRTTTGTATCALI